MTGTPVAGWALLIAIFAAAYLGTARADRR